MLWKEKLDSFLGYIFHIFEWGVRALLIFITLLISMQVFLRAAFEYCIPWAEEVSLIAFIYITFFTLAIGVRYDLHLRVQLFVASFPMPVRKAIEVLNNLILLAISVLMLYTGIKLTLYGVASIMPATRWPTSVIYFPTPVAGLMCCIHLVLRLLGIAHSDVADNYIKGAFKE